MGGIYEVSPDHRDEFPQGTSEKKNLRSLSEYRATPERDSLKHRHTQSWTLRGKLLKIGAQVPVTKRKVWLSFSESYPYAAWLRTFLARVQAHPLRCEREPAVGKTPSWKSVGRTLPWSRLLGENHRSRVSVRGQIPMEIAGFRLSSPHSSRQDSSRIHMAEKTTEMLLSKPIIVSVMRNWG